MLKPMWLCGSVLQLNLESTVAYRCCSGPEADQDTDTDSVHVLANSCLYTHPADTTLAFIWSCVSDHLMKMAYIPSYRFMLSTPVLIILNHVLSAILAWRTALNASIPMSLGIAMESKDANQCGRVLKMTKTHWRMWLFIQNWPRLQNELISAANCIVSFLNSMIFSFHRPLAAHVTEF